MATKKTPAPAPDDDKRINDGWPEYAMLDGQQVKLTRGFLRSLAPQAKMNLEVDFGEGPVRPFRFGSGPDEIQAEPGKPLRI